MQSVNARDLPDRLAIEYYTLLTFGTGLSFAAVHLSNPLAAGGAGRREEIRLRHVVAEGAERIRFPQSRTGRISWQTGRHYRKKFCPKFALDRHRSRTQRRKRELDDTNNQNCG